MANEETYEMDENIVQIHKEKKLIKHFYINLDEDIKGPKEYRPVFKALKEAKEKDSVTIRINTSGGFIASFIELFNAIQECKIKVKAEVYEASSAGSMIMLSCDEIEIKDFASIFIHSVSFSTGKGKVHENVASVKFWEKENENLIKTIFDGFLTENEIKEVINGKDYFFHTEEARKRLKNWIPIRDRKNKKK